MKKLKLKSHIVRHLALAAPTLAETGGFPTFVICKPPEVVR